MNDHIVIDCETLGSGRGQVVISLAALRFDLEDMDSTLELMEIIKERPLNVDKVSGVGISGQDMKTSDLIFIKIPLIESLRRGFTTAAGTIDWWMKKPLEQLEFNLATTSSTSTTSYLEYLSSWVKATASAHREGVEVWANSPRFDFEALEEYFARCNKEFPVHFRRERDIRTIRAFFKLPYPNFKEMGLESHNPIHDCFAQAIDMQKASAVLRDGESLRKSLSVSKPEEASSAELTPPTR